MEKEDIWGEIRAFEELSMELEQEYLDELNRKMGICG